MVSKFLFIEGARDTDNGDLRAAFQKLLNKIASGSMPRISMGDGKKQTIDKFLNSITKSPCLIKLDLDGPEADREKDLVESKLKDHEQYTHYMIYEMEAWFFSQPEILDEYYSLDISSKVKGRSPSSIPHPDEELQKLARSSKHKTHKGYHKVRDGANLLEMLDPNKLSLDFPDFKKLVENLKKSP